MQVETAATNSGTDLGEGLGTEVEGDARAAGVRPQIRASLAAVDPILCGAKTGLFTRGRYRLTRTAVQVA